MKVICAGLSKTGTTSLGNALRVLGYKVYDFPEHADIHGNEWLAIYRGEKTADFASMYEAVDAVTDLPAAFWYQEILEAFPDAKIILTVRDNDEVWVQSWVKHVQIFRELNVFSRLALAITKPLLLDLHSVTTHAVYGSQNPKRLAYSKRNTMRITREYRLLFLQKNCSFTMSNKAGVRCVNFSESMFLHKNFHVKMSEDQPQGPAWPDSAKN